MSCCATARPRSPRRSVSPGAADHELSAVGQRQAEAGRGVARRTRHDPGHRQLPAEALPRDGGGGRRPAGLDVRVEDGLRETDFGAWEGLTFAEVQERYGDDLTAWLASPKAAPTGGGESFATVARRVAAARDRILKHSAGRTVLVVTHVTPIKTLVRLALGAPPESLFRMELSAASLSAVAYYADGNASVRLLNETSHLR